MRGRFRFATVFYALLLLTPSSSEGAAIHFEINDLPDMSLGEDLWEYRYFLVDPTFPLDQGFTIFFDHSAVASLGLPPGAGTDASWDILLGQPEPGIPANGFYDGLAIVPDAVPRNPFVVNFVLLPGASLPGEQPFEIYTLVGGFKVIDSGMTARVAEPITLSLIGLGASALAVRTTHRRRSSRDSRAFS
jgi:hypothetical protein